MKHFKLKDPGSAITHFIGMLMAMFAATPLILRAMRAPDTVHVISLSIFIVSMILLYAASTTYHTFDKSKKVNFCTDCRFLYANLPDCPAWPHRAYAAGTGLEHCDSRHYF